MSIKMKTFLTINILCLLGLIGIYTFSHLIIARNIENQEKNQVVENVERVKKVMQRDIEALNATCGDWSLWDDTYYFVMGQNSEYIHDNLANSSFATLRLNMMIFLDNKGKIVYSKGFDLNTNKEAELSKDLDNYINSNSILLKHNNLDSIVSGLIMIDNKPMLVSSRPISTNDLTETKAGTLVVGKFIGNSDYKVMEDLTDSKITITGVGNKPSIEFNKQYTVDKDAKSYNVYIISRDSIACDTNIADVNGKRAINLRLDFERHIYNESNDNLKLFIIMYVFNILIISILGMFITESLFIGRINKLNLFIKSISLNKDTTQRIALEGHDEIASLAEATNNMLQEIDNANERTMKNKERLQRVLDGSSDGFWDIYIPTGKMFFSQRLLDMLGYEKNEFDNFIGLMKKVLTREASAKLLKAYRAILNGRVDSYWQEHYMQTKSGEWKWILFKGRVVKWDKDSKPLLMAGIATDITEAKKYNETIEYLSYHDSLTGLYNRHYILKKLEGLVAEKQLPLSIVMGDANGLKLVNDAFGHNEGDKLLIAISEILKKSCRKEDIIARLGGDEFLVLLPNTDEKKAAKICENIKNYCEDAELKPFKPSIALGICTINDEKQGINEIIEMAEDRMYKNKLLENHSARHSIIAVMERALLETDFETKEHTERICAIALKMGTYMKLPNNVIDELRLLSRLHDVGKTAIPREILTKPGRLTEEEWQIIKQHTEIGYRMAQSSSDLLPIAEGILSHHERWDGKGYPRGLKGKEIILTARIISIIDAYDVITNSRPYKQAATHEEAINEIERCSGTHFDPELVEIFINMFLEEENMKKCL